MKLTERVMTVTFLVALALPMAAQSLPRTSRNVSLDRLSGPAGIIFTGTVVRIERMVSENGRPASVRVTFRVDEAVRGCSAGETIAIDEWAELWERGDRYRRGQSALLFLYPPGDTQLTSPVAGDLGKVEVGPQGLLFTPQQARFLSSQKDGNNSQADVPQLIDQSTSSKHVSSRSERPLRYDVE